MRNASVFCLLSFVLAAVVGATALPTFGSVKHIDVSQYFVSTNYLNCLAERADLPTYKSGVVTTTSGQTFDLAKPCAGDFGFTFGDGLTNFVARVAAMDAADIDTALLGSLVQVWDLPEADAIRVARDSNNDVAAAMRACPGRFEGAALLPVVSGSDTCVDEAIAELERCANELGFRVWIAASNFGADHLYDAKFEPLLKRVEQLGVTIYLKDAYPIEEPFAALDGEDDPNEWGPALSNGQDLMVTATRLVMNGTFDRYPALRVVLPNLGEYLPFNLDRMSYMLGNFDDPDNVPCKKSLFYYAVTNRNFVLTTSGTTNETLFACAKRVMGADSLCFGTDWPFDDMKAQADALAGFDLTDAERDGVLGLNAQKYVFKGNPMKYFRDRDAAAYSGCVHSLKNVQQGELYTMRWDDNADYHMGEMLESGCSNSVGMLEWLCKNVLNDAPPPPPVTDLGCSAFAATNALGQQLAERNFDYRYRMTHALVYVPRSEKFHRPYASVSSVDCGWVGYDIGGLDNGTNDLSYAALFPYIPLDGMNEKGLMVTVLSLDGRPRPGAGSDDKSWMTEQYYPDRTNIVTTAAIRYLLDNADSTEAGINMLTNNFNMFQAIGGDIPIAANYHFYLCDKSGDTRVVEWLPPADSSRNWRTWVTNATSVSNFYFYDGYGHGSNRWEIMRLAIARQNGHLEVPDATHLARAVAQHKGAEQTSWTHWSIVYNLADLSAHIATLGNYDEIFPYRLDLDAPSDWTTEAPKSARPGVETNLPPFEATAEPGKVYRLADPISGSSGTPSSYAGASVSAVNRQGFTYDATNETLHAVATNEATAKCRAVFCVEMSSRDAGKAACSILAGVSETGLAGRVVRFRNSTGPGELSPSTMLMSVLNNGETFEAALKMMEAVKQSEGGCGFVLSDARGNVAVWGPAGAELEMDDASEMVRNSLDLRKGIYEIDGDGRGQFDELPGLMRLASTADTKAIVSMGYGHLDVMLPNSNVLWRAELEGVFVPAYGVVAEPPAVAHTTATLTYTNGNVVATNNQGRLVAETNAMLRVVYAADPGYSFPNGAKRWTRDFSVGDTATTPPAPETAPILWGITRWLQNVYTNRFTVMCETAGELPDLRLQYGEDYALSVGLTSTNGLKEGMFVCKASVTVEDAEGVTVPYRLSVGTAPIAGTEGTVRLWKNEDAAFTCSVWGDNQEGVQPYDWGDGVAAERYRCITNMFAHMAKAKPDFGFTTGDMSSFADYEKEILPGELRGANELFGREIPYHLVWGNHDCNGTFFGESYTNAAQRYFEPAASEEDGWFHLYRNDVLFIGVHWTWGKGDAEARYDAITNGVAKLLATDRAKNAKFRILVQHTPIFLEVYNVLPKVNWFGDTRLLDVAKAGGVDLVFSGHTHAYERIERDGLVQVVNGGMGYLDHGERWYNNYGSDTKVGGHQNTPFLWARQTPSSVASHPSTLAPAQPARMGCFQGYGMLSVEGNTLTYKAHAFNADGSYIGVADAFELRSKTVESVEKVEGVEPFTPSVLTSPVNNAAWKAYKDAQGEAWEIPEGQTGTDPVVNVSKTEIERFCAALNAGGSHGYRLPTLKELMEIFGGTLARDVSEWTSDVDPNSGWCRILGGNNKAVDFTWCREYDKPAMASPDCHANYLGFRVVDKETQPVVPSAMDQALAKLAEKVAAGETIAEVYQWSSKNGNIKDITSDWTNATLTTKYDYLVPVIFTGKGDLAYAVGNDITFGGGVAAPNATSLDFSHALKAQSNRVTVKGEFRGGVASDEWHFYLKCDELTLDNVTYRGQVFNAVTDDRTLNLVGDNDFSGAVMSVGIDSLLKDPHEKFVTKLVAQDEAMLWLRRLDFTTRGVAEEVLGTLSKTAGFTVGENVTLVTSEDVLFGIKGATLTVDGAVDAAGVGIAGHLLGLLPQEATVTGSGALTTTHFGMCDKSTLNIGVSGVTTLSSVPCRTYADSADGCNVNYIGRTPDYALASGKDWLFNHAIAGKGCPDESAADTGVDLFYVYPTLSGGEQIVIDGFRGIDDETMRSTATNYMTAVGSYSVTARCFADMTHVYAPFYRQATLDTAMDCATNNATGVIDADANARYLAKLCEGPAYADITNALTTYFTKWNNGRKLVFAAHSQGSALLRLVMENYFTLPENLDKAKLIVCSYQIGYGIGQSSIDKITAATGVKFAEKADDTNVIVSYNTMSRETTDYSILLPFDTLAINPINWSRGTDLADKTLNFGALTNAIGTADVIVPHLYGARVADTGAKRGRVVVCAELVGQELAEELFGPGSLHGNDYGAYWEDLRKNCFDRIAASVKLVEVVTNGVPQVADATWAAKVQGHQGQEWTSPVVSPVDGTLYAPADAAGVKLVYTIGAAKAAEGYYFANGETSASFQMATNKVTGVWELTVTAGEIAAATKTGKPTLQLGVVAQRYPWNGTVDVGYRATFWPAGKSAAVEVTVGESVMTNDFAVAGQGEVVGTVSVDLKDLAPETKGKATFRVVEK